MRSWTDAVGGPWGALTLLVVQVLMLALLGLDWRVPVAICFGVLVLVAVVERPLLGVGMLIVARLLSTGALVFLRIGKIGIGPFEPALILCLIGLVHHATVHRLPLWRDWPWRNAFLALLLLTALSLLWCVDVGDGVSDLLPLLLILANSMVILAFVRTWEDFRAILWFWVGACVMVGVLTLLTTALGIETTEVTFKAASGGGRETGLGQQPNWFAMNLMFIIHTCFGLALLEKKRWMRISLVLAGFFIFFMMLKSGSRGGAYATLIGGVFAALAHPLFRKWFARFAFATFLVFAVGILFDFGDSAQALTRIGSNLSLEQNYRQLNWMVCFNLFRDTWGLGIGAGGYDVILPEYNNYLAQSLYDYPHGIFWEVLAHYGVLGFIIAGWFLVAVLRMGADLARRSKGTAAEVFAWTMPAAMLGYAAWSFVEFTIAEKPFWEFLTLYTALWIVVRRADEEGTPLPAWDGLPKLWGDTNER